MGSGAKKIGLVSATSFAVGAMIGGGVFVLTGVALQKTGPSAVVSFLIAGLLVLCSALSFAVIAGQAKAKESGYVQVGKVLRSPVWGFLTSWCFYLNGIISVAFVLNAFGEYVHTFMSPSIPVVVWGLAAAGLLTLINLGPASEIGKVETTLVGAKLVILLLFIVFGVAQLHGGDLVPFTHGVTPIFATSSYLFIAFLGFNVITSIAGDIHEPQKTVPRAIFLSMIIVTVVYAGVVAALLAAHLGNYTEASVGLAAQRLIGPIGGGLVIAGALISTLSSANANILGSSEVMVRLARHKQVPTILGHLWNGHPYVSVLLGAVLYSLLLLSHQTAMVIDLANMTAIVAMIIVNAAAIRMLVNKQARLPFGWALPAVGVVGATLQFVFMSIGTLFAGLALIGVGSVIYITRERYFRPKKHRQITGVVNDVEGPLSRSLKSN